MNIINCLPRAEMSSTGQKYLLVKSVSEEFSTRKILIRVATTGGCVAGLWPRIASIAS